MKLNFTLVFILTLLFSQCNSETNTNEDNEQNNLECIENNGLTTNRSFTIISKEDVVLFLENPYKEINGEVSIGNLDDISFLNCVEKIRFLNISNCNIENLEGLTNLVEISELQITYMPSLKNLNGLNSINKIEHLSITRNPSLIDLKGLESLKILGGIRIENNESLETLDGLENVTTNIEYNEDYRSHSLAWQWRIYENPKLTSISALNNVSGELKSHFKLYECPSLINLGVFQSITKSYGLSVINCESLTSLNCFPNLIETGSITVNSAKNIRNISFSSLEKATYLGIDNNDSLNKISFNSLQEISGGGNGDFSIKIDDNDSLTSLNGIENL